MGNTFSAQSYVFISDEEFASMLQLIEAGTHTVEDAFNEYANWHAEVNMEIINSIRNDVIAEIKKRLSAKLAISIPYNISGTLTINGAEIEHIIEMIDHNCSEADDIELENIERNIIDMICDVVFDYLMDEEPSLVNFPEIRDACVDRIVEIYKSRNPERFAE